MTVRKDTFCREYSEVDEHFASVGQCTEALPGAWTGVKDGLVSFHECNSPAEADNGKDNAVPAGEKTAVPEASGLVLVDHFVFRSAD